MAYTWIERFEWDENKEKANRRKHGVSFEQALLVFSNAQTLDIFDEAHSQHEERFISIGPAKEQLLVVVWVERVESVARIISARDATRRERELYFVHMRERS